MADDHYLVLARRWRPQTFKDVVGQDHITRTLQNAVRAGRISHAFLFIGSRGIGKTTSARILAKCLNCTSVDVPTPEPCGTCANCTSIAAGSNIDVIEIDGASNNSVEDVRQIRENVRLVPSGSRYKVYVIDEVHQLSIAAFNALLKTLEEPPAHAVFILATTEAHKIPATIISRCQRFDFRRVGLDDLTGLLRKICDAEHVACSDEALYAIARAADGGVRDAESILDQLISYCDTEITFKDVFDVLGLVDWQVLHTLCEGLRQKDVAVLLRIVDDVVSSGKDLSEFAQEILRYFRNLLVIKSGAPRDLLALPEAEIEVMAKAAEGFTLTELIRLVEQFADLTRGLESQLAQRTALEALLIRLAQRSIDVSVDSVLEKLAMLGEGIEVQDVPAPPPAEQAPKPPAPEKKSLRANSAPKKVKTRSAESAKLAAAPPPGATEAVDPSAVKAALEDPHIAEVVDVFKGRIVRIHEEIEHSD
ncbi:MAG: DNA polymerase III subunit gamma/tau [Candidatus Hydrogenedentes bacterium]|nr:DNA polymerase III subunit gamma/tau [Candidatus Hydrogenedentota bacterium]